MYDRVMSEESSASHNRPPFPDPPLRAIRGLDYTVIFARDLPAMRRFYTEVMRVEAYFELGGGKWVELRVGSNILALSEQGLVIPDRMPPAGTACLQLAFRVRCSSGTRTATCWRSTPTFESATSRARRGQAR